MPTTSFVEISKIKLDLRNFRTTPQKNEEEAIRAMISISPDWFYALMESIIEDGYLHTENIIILQFNSDLIVKEGNRRIAILKLLHGLIDISDFGLPTGLIGKAKSIDLAWKKENTTVPCTIFEISEADKVDKIIALAHGKGEKAGRDKWTSVARARHNRDEKMASEPILDILEKYLSIGKNLTLQQKERWSGDYPLAVLDEAIKKIISRMDVVSVIELFKKYPAIKYRDEFEGLLRDIGLGLVGFPKIRNSQSDFATEYGILPKVIAPNPSSSGNPNQPQASHINTTTPNPLQSNKPNSNPSPPTATPASTGNATPNPVKSFAINDPRNVTAILKKFNPKGSNRQKVVALHCEIKKLKLKDNPIAFCFLLRSMFEISAKIYCQEYSIVTTKKGGNDKTLVELLRDITNHLTNNSSNKPMVKVLHGAMTEIGRSDGILSVTSMNQLVHNPSFSVSPPDVCTLFGNIYPLLEAMN